MASDSLFGRSFSSDLYDIVGIILIGGAIYYATTQTDIVSQIQNNLKNTTIKLPRVVTNQQNSSNNLIGNSGGSLSAGGSWNSASWNNGKVRTLTGHGSIDPYDKVVSLAAGSNRKLTINGKGLATLQGDQTRIYINVNNYNAKLVGDFAFLSGSNSGSDVALRLRSRHQEGGSTANKFGGYGVAFNLSGEVDFKREDYHTDSGGVHVNFGEVKIPAFRIGQFYNLGLIVKDTTGGVLMQAYVNGKMVAQAIDKKPQPQMHNASLRHYAWVRHNGPSGYTMKNVSLGSA